MSSTRTGTLSPRPTVLLHGMFTSVNFGDTLMALIVAGWLRETEAELDIVTVRASPEVNSLLGTRTVTLPDVRRVDGVLLSGGGYFQFARGGRATLRRSVKNVWPLWLGAALRRPVAVVGVGVGPVPDASLRAIVRSVRRAAPLMSVRDRVSTNTLEALGVRPGTLEAADITMTLSRDDLPRSAREHADAILAAADGRRPIGVHLTGVPEDGEDYARLYRIVERVLQRADDAHVFLLQDHANERSSQTAAQARLLRAVDARRATVVEYPGAFELCALLAGLDGVLTDKLHVGLVAAAMGTPPVSVARHPKNLAAYAAIEIPERCTALAGHDDEVTEALVERLLRAQPRLVIPPSQRDLASVNRALVIEFARQVRSSRDRRRGDPSGTGPDRRDA